MESTRTKMRLSDIILFIVFLLLLALPVYLCYDILVAQKKTDSLTQETATTEEETNADPYPDAYEEPEGPKYEEINQAIEGQTAYIVAPTNIDENNPPSIILYSHGSNTRVISDMFDPFMMDLQEYGIYFTQYNFIFAASNEHDENWGNAASIADMANLQTWIEERYETSGKIYMIGFSMGGLPTMHFVQKYPENIEKIALLAPTTRTYEWNQTEVNKIMNIDIKIWHGTNDVNIGIVNSRNFVQSLGKLGKKIELIEIEGKAHFDVDKEYMTDILTFFQAE